MLPVRFLHWCYKLPMATFRRLRTLGMRGVLTLLRQLLFTVMLVAFILMCFVLLTGALVTTWNTGPAEMLDLPLISFMNGIATMTFLATAIITYRFIIWVLGKGIHSSSEED
jgi:hypothetical protein